MRIPDVIKGANADMADLRTVLFQAIPVTGRIMRDVLIEIVSEQIGLAIDEARPKINSLIDIERSKGRLRVTPGSWREVWRA